MTTDQLLQDLRSFFFKVNSLRTQIMRSENPNEIYDQFPQDEPSELVIRKGMSQYEDLAKHFKKKGKRPVTISQPEPEIETVPLYKPKIKKTDENYNEPEEQISKEKTSKKVTKKEKETPKIKTISKKNEEKEENEEQKKNITKSKIKKEEKKEENENYNKKELLENKNISKKNNKQKKNCIKRTVGTEYPIANVHESGFQTTSTLKIANSKSNFDDYENNTEDNENSEKKNEEKKSKNKKNNYSPEKTEEEENWIKNPEPGYENSNIESAEYIMNSSIKIKAEWYYINKKKPENESENSLNLNIEDNDPEKEEKVILKISTNTKNKIIFHWGIYKAMSGLTWFKPPKESYPPKTKEIDNMSVETEFPKNNFFIINLKRGQGYKDYIGGINFVIFEPETNIWYNNYRKDFQIKFKLKVDKTKSHQILISKDLLVPDFINDVINCEANYGSWTLMHRYNKCSEIINNWDLNTDNEKWIWILIWLRYSFLRQLDWQRNYNTRPALLSGAMAHLSDLLTGKFSDAFLNEKNYQNLIDSKSSIIKNILALLGKGTGNGQEIRDEILKVMHRNKIPKCPQGNFYEQWHQKLHNNTTPEDITICQAVINFLKAKGDLKVYWKTLKEGGISKERLASYERNIRDEPWYKPEYNVGDFENYLKILKSVHASTDLDMTYESCKGIIGGACSKMDEILRNKNSDDVIAQIRRVAEVREELQNVIKGCCGNNGKLREVLFLELSLEVYVRQLVEKVIHIKLDYKNYIIEIGLVLRNIKVSYPNFEEFNLCYEDWKNIVEPLMNDQSKDSSLKVKSIISRLGRLLTSVVDYYNIHYDAKGKYFGKECNCDNFAVEMFSEELIRGSIFFALSMLLKKIEPIIRKNAQLGEWLIISRGKENVVSGKLIHVPKLHEVQFTKYTEPTVIITESVSGDEEIPVNCSCLVIVKSENYPDVLAHVSVRARNLNVPFAVCFNEQKADKILTLLNKNVDVELKNQEIIFNVSKTTTKKKKAKNSDEENAPQIKVVDSGDTYKKIFLELNEFDKNSVGAKSNNTKKVLGKVPDCDWLKYPESFAIPFNVHEYFLSLKENNDIKEEINEYIEKIEKANKSDIIKNLLEKCKNLTLKIKFIENSETEKLKNRLLKFGITEKEFTEAFTAIKNVWASKFNERVFIATSKVGIKLNDIKMSVLCQKIIPADYAFVIHTKNPTNNNINEIFAELVIGMGETLVGAYDGQSFSFSYDKKKNNYDIKSYPNKTTSLKNSGFIFRSDSNTEDLEGFSGAGLFDSIPMVKDKSVQNVYYNNKLFTDKKFVDNLIKKISMLGIGVEKLYGGVPQDIEGVYYKGDVYIVQTRPQV